MKRAKKTILSVALIASMLMATACGGKGTNDGKGGKGDSDKTLYVATINKGYGTAAIEAMLDKFCKERDLEYVLYPVYDDSELTQKIEAGKEVCNYDLVFTGARSVANKKYLLELSDVLDSTIDSGDRSGKKISECIESTVYGALEDPDEEGKFYKMPWTAGVNGLLLNYTAIDKALGTKWQEKYPCRTTNELLDFCAALKKAGLAPFVHAAATDYYSFLYQAWFAQYNGEEGLSDYFNALSENFMGEKVVGYDVAHNKGVLESAKVMESIFANGYSHEKSNSIDWEVTQTYFMSGEAAMLSNGDWNNLEMMKQFPDSDIRFMKLPIISALAEKLGITDEQLALLVDYVDGEGEKPTVSSAEYSEDDLISIVKEARSWVASYVDHFNVVIPEYSTKTELSKEFLKFMVSDEGQSTYIKASNGLTMCYGYDLEKDGSFGELSEFAKTRWAIAKGAKFYITERKEAYARAGLAPFQAKNKAPIESLLSRTDDRYTAQMVYEYDYDYFKDNWSLIQSKLK